MPARLVAAALAVALLAALLAVEAPAPAQEADVEAEATDPATPALRTPFALADDRDVDDRLAQPEDRYALAGGCYAVEVPGEGWLARDGDALALADAADAATPLHFQATRLGEYLLATNEGEVAEPADAWWTRRGFVSAADLLPSVAMPGALGGVLDAREGLLAELPLPSVPTTDDVHVAESPSPSGEWRIAAAGDDPDARVPGTRPGDDREPGPWQTYRVELARTGQQLTVADGEVGLAPHGQGREVAFHLVAAGQQAARDAGCPIWPEVTTDTSGEPAPAGRSPAAEARGFVETHVHGMAFEFLGGQVRCGRPWHPYGVEHALGDCEEQGNAYNGVLEVPLAGRSPQEPVTDYDPVGWPTFDYWPAHDTLTHEQWYWKWLERSYHAGLRLSVNLLVDNAALCQIFPVTKNSCNEMDGVRLQAQRLFELQDYVDAQSGGPGEGWLRIVTSPIQARETIADGRLAVVLGIEISELFDCRTSGGQAQCTAEEITERLEEVRAMGVRQVQLINKFDNALSGVTGDGGATGLLVNTGNRLITGRWWDMQRCEEVMPPADEEHAHASGSDHDHGHGRGHGTDGHRAHPHPPGQEHDRAQLTADEAIGPIDDALAQGAEAAGAPGEMGGTKVLAGRIIDQFAETEGMVAPVYPEPPHCNARGLSELGEHAIAEIIDAGMIFDPDHMSALAQRQALDFIEHELVPAERAAARDEGRRPVQPALLSSHSWANDVVYQRIYQLAGFIGPRTAAADAFVERWAAHKGWFDRWAPRSDEFALGFGADTNGFGAQPAPRREPQEPLDYSRPWTAPIGDVEIGQHTAGVRTYDISDDGVAHYGLFADWLAELRLAADEWAQRADPEQVRALVDGGASAGEQVIDDLLGGAEAYLRRWERAVYPAPACVADQSMPQVDDLHALVGGNVEGFLRAAGQPVSREDHVYVYCAEDGDGQARLLEVAFDAAGRAVEVSQASGRVLSDHPVTNLLGEAVGPDGVLDPEALALLD